MPSITYKETTEKILDDVEILHSIQSFLLNRHMKELTKKVDDQGDELRLPSGGAGA